MRIEAKVTIRGVPPGGQTPPGGFVTVDAAVGASLVGLGFARDVGGESAVEPVVEPVVDPIFEPIFEPAVEAVVEPVVETVVEPVVEPVSGADKRRADIAEAIELLDAEADYVKTGDRAGRPKVKAIEEVVGYDVTMAEVDEVFAAREAAE